MSWTFYDANGTLLQGLGPDTVTSAHIVDGTIVTADLGNITGLDSTSTITLDATTDIVLDADGADILLKDGGTTFGSFNQTGGELRILSGSTPTLAMTFAGANATLAGNLTVSGTTTTVNSTVLTVVDPVIHLQTASGGGALSGDTNKDVGLAMQYHTGSAAKTAFLGFDDSDSKLMYIPDATISSEVASGTIGTIKANIEASTLAVTGATTIRTIAYTWPASDSAGSLTSDGSGALSWAAAAAGVGLGLVIALG